MLVLVVGPSGVGKDSLLRGARRLLRHNPHYVFPQREINRPPSRHERNVEISEATYARRVEEGGYALYWEAHEGLVYGVRRIIEGDLAAGRIVVANVSRSKLDEWRERYGPVRIVAINADPEKIRERLIRRGREKDPAKIEERVAAAAAYVVAGEDVRPVLNNWSMKEGIATFLERISRLNLGLLRS